MVKDLRSESRSRNVAPVPRANFDGEACKTYDCAVDPEVGSGGGTQGAYFPHVVSYT